MYYIVLAEPIPLGNNLIVKNILNGVNVPLCANVLGGSCGDLSSNPIIDSLTADPGVGECNECNTPPLLPPPPPPTPCETCQTNNGLLGVILDGLTL